MTAAPAPSKAFVLFDVDGTLLDSADGIVAGIRYALRRCGSTPPAESVLRSDVGPPLPEVFAGLGLDAEQSATAVRHYRTYYLSTGVGQASIYAGIPDALAELSAIAVLATATAKRIETAEIFLRRHGLVDRFTLVGGGDDRHVSKADIVAETYRRLGSPPPHRVVMVGDRRSDISAAQAVGLRTIAVRWGYGSAAELAQTTADLVLDRPAELPAAVRTLLELDRHDPGDPGERLRTTGSSVRAGP